jgi:cystathionine gamma-lyase
MLLVARLFIVVCNSHRTKRSNYQGKIQAECFLEACTLILQATSFGGVHTTAERRARWGGDAIADGFIRLSVGCEDTQDVLDDVAQSLAAVSTT